MPSLRRLLRQMPTTFGRRLDRDLRSADKRRAQMVSFLESSGYRSHHPDAYEASLRRRRLAKLSFRWLTAFGVAWVAIESAKAFSIF